MSTEPLEERYFKWLYRQVASTRITNPQRTYWRLLREIHKYEFHWFVPNDDNRVEDGKELRLEFYNESSARHERGWDELGCSALEMLIALSRRLSFNGGGVASEWFWILINNLGLSECNDSRMDEAEHGLMFFVMVDVAMDRMINRTYDYEGSGGLFPLRNPDRNQAQVEIWEQMNNYLSERMG